MLQPTDTFGQHQHQHQRQHQHQQHQPQNQQQQEHDEAVDEFSSNAAIPPGARSPHPYRRQSIDIQDRIFVTNLAARERQPFAATSANAAATSSNSISRHRLSRQESGLSDASLHRDGESRRGLTTSPSDSGTEADDERSTYLRGLPSATAKARKGLKDHSGTATPSDFDGVKKKLLDEGIDRLAKRRRGSSGDSANEAERQSQNKLAQYGWKWRGELLRRVLEHVCLCGLTHCCLESRAATLRRWPYTYDWQRVLHDPVEKAKWLVAATLLLYLIRAFWLWTKYVRAVWKIGSMTMERVPAPGDPGATLYPLLLPLAVSSAGAMTSSKPAIVLLNLVLGPCAYAVTTNSPALANLYWTATILLALPHGINYSARMPFYEDLTFLLPLHSNIVAIVQYLCSTSLLSAESQLLSAGLINLLFFAKSPQSLILFALLWVGGLLMLVGCRQVMKWSTALARIPGWRFRSPRHAQAPASPNKLPKTAIGTLLRTSSLFTTGHSRDSSDDREWINIKHKQKKGLDDTLHVADLSMESIHREHNGFTMVETPGKYEDPYILSTRRHTLPSITRTDVDGSVNPPASPITPASSLQRQQRKRKAKNRPFLWLTKTQASAVKWLFALYSYTFAIVTILVPIRWQIQERALNGHEPIGWALSYLFGDLPSFRIRVIMSDLDTWIPLPPRIASLASTKDAIVPSLSSLRMNHVGAGNTRLLISSWCLANLTLGLLVVFRLRAVVEVDTRRKVFHGMMVSMFLPTAFLDPCFIALALTLMLAIFLLLDLFRATQLPPISRPLTHFLAPYVDGRDHKGPVVISPIFLLIGCAIPLWLSLAGLRRVSTIGEEKDGSEGYANHPWRGWEVDGRDLSMIAGVVCVGMGDAAASLIGRRYGRRRWVWSGGKSLEGSAAFVVAVAVGLLIAKIWMLLGGWRDPLTDDYIVNDTKELLGAVGITIGKAILAGGGASFTEAVLTAGNDNVIVPVVLWLLIRVLKL